MAMSWLVESVLLVKSENPNIKWLMSCERETLA
jgi:hypothetical protein